jgi:membrane protein involved in colicin uptake
MPTEQHIKIKEEASPHAAPTAAANSLGAEIIEANSRLLESTKISMAFAAEILKATQDAKQKSQEAWDEANAKHEAASKAAEAAIEKYEEARKIAEAYRKEVSAAIKMRDETQKKLDEAKTILEADDKAVRAASKNDLAARASNEDAKRRCDDAAKRHEVMDPIADDEDDGENGLKPSANENIKTDSDAADTKPSGKSSATCQRKTGSNKKAKHDNYVYIPDEINVEGCGMPEVNGKYTRCGDFEYFKAGKWNLFEGNFVLKRHGSRYWCISIVDQRSSKYFHSFEPLV